MSESMDTTVMEKEASCTVIEVPALGFGNPESKISYTRQRENGELPADVDGRAVEIITSGVAMRFITDTDDGCIDGRPAVELLYINEQCQFYTKPIEDAAEHERAKVAGGGYITALAMKQALEAAAGHVDADMRSVADSLASAGVHCGAHTGAHGHSEATDCGANDKIETILAKGVSFQTEIAGELRDLLAVAGLDFKADTYEAVMDGWQRTLNQTEYFAGSNGATRFSAIEESLKKAQEARGDYSKPVGVSKQLAGDHKEDYIIINYIDGKTFSQAAFRQQLIEEFPDIPDETRAQAFVVDVPRVVELAKAMTKDQEEDFLAALYAGIAYQLATAATLTDGTLRTFIVK